MNKGGQFQLEVLNKKVLPVESVETLIQKNTHIIKSHSWVTAAIDNYQGSDIVSTSIDNLVSFRHYPQNLYGIQPNYFQTADSYFLLDFGADFDEDGGILTPYLGHQYGSGLDFGE